MSPRSLFVAATVLVLANLSAAAVGTMCRNQDPYQSCTLQIVSSVTPQCEAYTDKSVKTACACSTLSLHSSCYTKLCTTSDTFIDIFNTMFNSWSCPNAPALKTAVFSTPATTTATATTTPPTGRVATVTSGGPISTSTSGAMSRGGSAVFRGTTAMDVLFLSVASVLGVFMLFGGNLGFL